MVHLLELANVLPMPPIRQDTTVTIQEGPRGHVERGYVEMTRRSMQKHVISSQRRAFQQDFGRVVVKCRMTAYTSDVIMSPTALPEHVERVKELIE